MAHWGAVHSTRIATFLLGAWIAGCLSVDLMAIEKGAGSQEEPPATAVEEEQPETTGNRK